MTHLSGGWKRWAPLSAVGLALCATIGSIAQATAAPPPPCRAADNTSARIMAQLSAWQTVTDPARVQQRDQLYHVPVVPAGQITLVTDTKICNAAAKAMAQLEAVSTTAPVYVIEMGGATRTAPTWYAVHDPARPAGEFEIIVIFTSNWVKFGGWTG